MPAPKRDGKARILLAANAAWNLANFRAGLIRGLQASGYEIVAAAPPDDHVARLQAMDCRFVPIRMDNQGVNPWLDAQLFARFSALFQRERPQAYLGFTIKPNVYGSLAAQLQGIPVINNVSGLGTAFIRNTWITLIVRMLYRAAFQRSAQVFFQNEDDRKLFLELGLVEPGRTRLLPGSGIDLQHYTPTIADNDPCSSAARDPEAPVFTLIARLILDKGIREYVEAARQVRARFPRARFQLLGFLDVENQTALTREMLEAWIAEGAIEYLGTADDVRPIIAASDCVVLPSYREGTPRTLLEAAAMGKPLIATDVPGCRNVVEHQKNGFLCKVRSGDDLACRMLDFIALSPSARRAQGTQSRAMVEHRFDEQIVVESYAHALESALLLRSGSSFRVSGPTP